ncbi:MAG: phage holin family protein [Richelia sp. SL_2_1]|nr:phage holin family protein [Richelia sp. SL_2_1]
MTFVQLITAIMKAKTIKLGISLLLSFLLQHLLPVSHMVSGIIFLVAIDWITGRKASAVEGKPLLSSRLRDSVKKLLDYLLLAITSLVVQEVWLPGFGLVYIVTMYCALTEFKSILENIKRISGVSLWRLILMRIGGKG